MSRKSAPVAYILSTHFTPRSTRPVSDDPFIFIRLGSLPLRYICVNLSNCVPHNLLFPSRFSSDVPFVFHTSLRTRFILFAAIYQPRCVVYFRSPFYDSLPLPTCFFQWRSFFFERYFTRTTKCIRTVIIHGFSPRIYLSCVLVLRDGVSIGSLRGMRTSSSRRTTVPW